MSALLTPFLWSFIPSQLTTFVLPYLTTYLPSLFPPAPQGSPQYAKNHRWAYTLLVVGYIGWTFVQSDVGVGEDMYALLGVGRGVDDDGLRKAFRGLSRRYHPDRNPGNEDLFILIRQSYETLTDPVKRYAYDRFGPDILHWKAKTVKEFMYTGMLHSLGFHVVSAGFMLLLTITGQLSHSTCWRYTLFILLLTMELSLVLSPTPNPGTIPIRPQLSWIVPRRWTDIPQFIWIRTIHRLWASLSIGITQLSGVWAPKRQSEKEIFARVLGLVKGIENEAARQFHGEVVPILSRSANPLQAQYDLCSQIENIMVESTISSHPLIRDEWHAAVQDLRRRPPTVSPHGVDRSRGGPRPVDFSALTETQLAARIPLPPSPPPSPRPRADARLR